MSNENLNSHEIDLVFNAALGVPKQKTERSLAAPLGSVIPLKDILAGFAAELWGIQRQMIRGCGNHGCRVQAPTGMATNDRCHCMPRDFAQRLRDIADRLSPNDPDQRRREPPKL